jgi:hypothetical protein
MIDMGKHASKLRKRRSGHSRKARPGEHRKRTEREETREQAQQVWAEVVGADADAGQEHRHHRGRTA